MSITFAGVVSVIANGWKGATAVRDWATKAPLKHDFIASLVLTGTSARSLCCLGIREHTCSPFQSLRHIERDLHLSSDT